MQDNWKKNFKVSPKISFLFSTIFNGLQSRIIIRKTTDREKKTNHGKTQDFYQPQTKKLSGFRESETKKENEDLNDSDYFSPSLFKENSTGSISLN